jgi:hypothetical protein
MCRWSGVAHLKPVSPGLLPDILMEDAALQEQVRKQESSASGTNTKSQLSGSPEITKSD